MLPDRHLPQAGTEVASFGHYGQDCALVLAVPDHDLAYACTSAQLNNRLDQYAKSDDRAARLARAAVAATAEGTA